ncbi:MAG: glutamine synthetase family protein [Aestuariivirga sp.]
MSSAPLAMLAVPDLSGIFRGKSIGAHRRDIALKEGLVWPPANIMISPLGSLPADSPFGPMGEIRLRAVDGSCFRLPAGPSTPEMDVYLADIHDIAGKPWEACPRTALKNAIALLKAKTGLTMKLAFEHEFTLIGQDFGRDPSFSLASIRRAGSLALEIDQALLAAGMPAEQIVPEYGDGQYEIAATPKEPLRACDEAIVSREIIRDAARRAGIHASFVPKPSPTAPGNGIHGHFSLWQGESPVMAVDGWLTRLGGAFAAGVIRHAEALMLFTVGSTNSFLRIRPHSWVGAYTCVGTRNREAMLRFCPRSDSSAGPLPKASLEFRVFDATANIYLAIAALIHAGLDGIDKNLESPPDVASDPDGLSANDRKQMNIRTLPENLAAAINSAEKDGELLAKFPPLLIEALLSVRRDDVRKGATVDAAELAARLSKIY